MDRNIFRQAAQQTRAIRASRERHRRNPQGLRSGRLGRHGAAGACADAGRPPPRPTLVRRQSFRYRGILSGARVAPIGHRFALDVRASDRRPRRTKDRPDLRRLREDSAFRRSRHRAQHLPCGRRSAALRGGRNARYTRRHRCETAEMAMATALHRSQTGRRRYATSRTTRPSTRRSPSMPAWPK
jgi:hypothetical protein